MKQLWVSLLAITCVFSTSNSSMADGLRLEQTRLIFSGDNSSQTVTVANDDSAPYLIQAGVTTKVDGGKSPYFVVTPPLFRIDAKSKFSLRVLLKQKSELPKDRESIFYLNTRAIPATGSSEHEQNNAKLVFVTNIIIKLIYRPSGLEAPSDTTFQQVTLTKKGSQWQFINPTPHYMTLVNIKFNNQPYKHSVLIAPYDYATIGRITGNITNGQWQMLNDYGGTTAIYSQGSSGITTHSLQVD